MNINQTDNYWIYPDDTLVFKPKFNSLLDEFIEIINQHHKLYFSNSDYDNLSSRKVVNSSFNQHVSNLPSHLTHLKFGYSFNQPVSNLPSQLAYLFFDYSFNQDVGNLPQNLHTLILGYEFNHPLINLPLNLCVLRLECKFMPDITNIPVNLDVLDLYCEFNKDITNLPPHLIELCLGENFDKNIDIPLSVKHLKILCKKNKIIDYLSNSIECLRFGKKFNSPLSNLPSSINTIIFNMFSEYNYELNCLPHSIHTIQLPIRYSLPISSIPKGLKKVICSPDYKFKDKLIKRGIEVKDYE